MADVFDKEPISFIDQNEQFPVLNEKVGLTYQQFKTLVENTNYLYNNLGLSSLEVGSVTTQFPSPGSFSDVIVEHNISYINGKPVDTMDFLFKLPTPRISASLYTKIVDESIPTGMTLLTSPIKEIINGAEVTTGYEFEFHANIPQTPEYYLQYVEQNLSESEKAQARANIGAGTSNFSGNYKDLKNIPSFSDVAYSGSYSDLLNKPSSVLYTTQTLTDEEKQVARENIGAGTSNFNGDYNSLSNRPTRVSQFLNDANYISSDELFFVSYAEVQDLTETQKLQARNNIGAGTSNFDGNYSSLVGSPTNLSDFNNDTGFITLAEVPTTDLSNYYTKAETDNLISSITIDLSDYYTKEQVDTLIANIEIDLTDYYTKTETDTAINTKFNSLSTVAKTGSYTDLIDTPNIPTKTSDITNDSGFITNAVDNLVNYYTKTEIGNMFADNVTFKFVTELPLTGVANVVYFVSNADGTSGNLFDEYVWTNTNTWELIGSASIDLSNYYTKTEVDSLLPDMTNYYTKDDLSGKIIPIHNTYSSFNSNGTGLTLGDLNGYGITSNLSTSALVFKSGSINGDNATKSISNATNVLNSLVYRNSYSNIFIEFDRSCLQLSGDYLYKIISGDSIASYTKLNVGTAYFVFSNSTDENVTFKAGHIYLIGGSSGAYTTTDITPLTESSIDSISVNGIELPITNKNVNISIPTKLSDLTNDSGFITDSTSTLTNYYDKNSIDTMLNDIPKFDSSLYYTKTETDTIITRLPYIAYEEQTLSATQKLQARTNIGAGTSNFDGSYNSLTDTPTFATVATSGSYTDLLNRPVIDTSIAQTTNAVQNQAIYNRFVSVDNDISSATTTANNAYSTAQSASSTANSINTKLNSLTLVDNGDNSYTLKFTQDNVVVGTITIPTDQYVKSITQSTINNTVNFIWNKTSTEYPDGTYTLDLKPYVYTAGNGISTSQISDTDNRNKISVYLDTADENNKLFFNSTTGGLNVDLSGYYTSVEVDSLLPNMELYYTKTEVDGLLPDMSSYYTKTETDSLIPDLSNYYTKTEANKSFYTKVASTIIENGTTTFYASGTLTKYIEINGGSSLLFNNNSYVSSLHSEPLKNELFYAGSNRDYSLNNVNLSVDGNNINQVGTVNVGATIVCSANSDDNKYLLGHIYYIDSFNSSTGTLTTVDITPITSITIDSALSTTSENPVQNKIITENINNIKNNISNIYNSAGGFAGGYNSDTIAGGAVGTNTISGSGFAGGAGSKVTSSPASLSGGNGGAIGQNAWATSGGAVGDGAKTSSGFAGGYNAVTETNTGGTEVGIDAIQLGTGTNNTEKTLQIYDDNIYNANTHTLTVNNITLNGSNLTNVTADTVSSWGFFKGRSRTLIGNYSSNDNTTVTVGSLANYKCFEIVFTGVSSRKISTGINSCVNGTYFSCYYPNVGGIRGYKISDTSIQVEDVDGTTTWALYGIN